VKKTVTRLISLFKAKKNQATDGGEKTAPNSMVLLKKRFTLQFVFLFLLPICLMCTLYFFIYQKQILVEKQIARLEKKTQKLCQMQLKKERYHQKYANCDSNYISHHVEPLKFLSSDVEKLSQIKGINYSPLQKRLEFLKGGENKLTFIEKEQRKSNFYSEVELISEHSVDVNYNDIRKLITLIEGVKIGELVPNIHRPELFIKKIHLIKKDKSDENKAFTMDLELLQRGNYEKDT